MVPASVLFPPCYPWVSRRHTSPSRTTRPAVGPAQGVPMTYVPSSASGASLRQRVRSAAAWSSSVVVHHCGHAI
jgi:hypothetical protein